MHPGPDRTTLRDASSVDHAFRFFGSALLSSGGPNAEKGEGKANGEPSARAPNSINDVRALFDGPAGNMPQSVSPAPSAQRAPVDPFGRPTSAASGPYRTQQIPATAPLPAMPFQPSWGSPMGSPLQQIGGGFGFPRQIVREARPVL